MKKNLGPKLAVCPLPVFLVATYDREGKPNVMTVSWGGVCCSDPPCIAISVRKATHTHHALMERRAFTVNLPSREHAEAAAYFGRASGRDEDKFKKTGMTPVRSRFVDAPYIDEMPVVLECRITQISEPGSHTHFVGQVVNAMTDDGIREDIPLIEQCGPIVFGMGRYYGIGDMIEPGSPV